MRKVCVVVGSRANYSSIKSAMCAIARHPDLELQTVVAASALLERYGHVGQLVEQDGVTPAARVYMLIEGETPATMAKSTGLGLVELPTVFEQLRPDLVLTVGDRFETMATALAAAYMNIPLAHTMGGEVSGTIDESIRHAVTKFSHIHFPACAQARDRIIRLGERAEDVYLVLMRRCRCLVGNSSSAIREGAFIGTPAVNIGTRQAMRERGRNVVDVDYHREAIADAIVEQVKHGPYESEPIYGDGHAGERIADVLAHCSWRLQKRITY